MFRFISGVNGALSAGASRSVGLSPVKSAVKSNSQAVNASGNSQYSQISEEGQLIADLQRLKTKDPARFKKILSDTAKEMHAASFQVSGHESRVLAHFATRFDKVAETGDFTPLALPATFWKAHGYSKSGMPANSGNGMLAEFLGNQQDTHSPSQIILSKLFAEVHKAI